MEPIDFHILFPHIPDDSILFLQKLLQLDPKLRIKADEVMCCCIISITCLFFVRMKLTYN